MRFRFSLSLHARASVLALLFQSLAILFRSLAILFQSLFRSSSSLFRLPSSARCRSSDRPPRLAFEASILLPVAVPASNSTQSPPLQSLFQGRLRRVSEGKFRVLEGITRSGSAQFRNRLISWSSCLRIALTAMDAHTSKELLDQLSFPDSLLICGKRPPLSSWAKKGGPATASEAKPLTAAVPPSQVLSKVKGFLGLIAEANDKLELAVRKGLRTEYELEVLDGNKTEYIEMDLLLGIADLHSAEAVAAAEAAVSGHRELPPSINGGFSDSDSCSDDEEDETSSSTKHSVEGCESVRCGKRNKRPKIVVLNSSSE